MPSTPRTARRSSAPRGSHERPADRADGSISAIHRLREALSLPSAAEVDGALYFGVGDGTTALVMEDSPGRLMVLAELAATAELGAGDWSSLAAAWSSRIDGEVTGRPLVLDDVLWLSTQVEAAGEPALWVGRVQRFLRWADEVRLRARPIARGLH